ncbi:type II secretion system protein [Candidatus Omnitrophota bacterium]
MKQINQRAKKQKSKIKFPASRKGVTLAELVMVIVVVGILMSGLSLGVKEAIDLWLFLSFRNEIVSQGRMALTRMGREIRQMKTRTPSEEPILLADSNHLQFTDVNDAVIDYQISSGSLMRNADILADGVSSLEFCYYDRDKTAICSPVCECNVAGGQLDDIEIVGIRLQVQSGSQSMILRSQVYPRNLGS